MFRWMGVFKRACHRFKFPATEFGNTPVDFSGSRVRQRSVINTLSINPKVPCSASIRLQEEQRGVHRTAFSGLFSVELIWTSVYMKLQIGRKGKVREKEDLLMLTLLS